MTRFLFWRDLSVELRLDGERNCGSRETEVMSVLPVRNHGGLDRSACGRSGEEWSDFG